MKCSVECTILLNVLEMLVETVERKAMASIVNFSRVLVVHHIQSSVPTPAADVMTVRLSATNTT
jgi:hypothetical protein